MTDFDRVTRFYDSTYDKELQRSTTAGALLELRRALAIMQPLLSAGSEVLDLGAGSGRYSAELARLGHFVTVADLSPALLRIARQRIEAIGQQGQIRSYDEANAIGLGRYDDLTYDAVVAFGPFYHLLAEQERQAAAKETWRVLKRGGRTFVMYIPLLSGLNGLIWRAAERPGHLTEASIQQVYETGNFVSQSEDEPLEMHFCKAGEIQNLSEGVGFQTEGIYSLRGYARGFEPYLLKLEQSQPKQYRRFLSIIEDTQADRDSIALGGHAVYVGQRTR